MNIHKNIKCSRCPSLFVNILQVTIHHESGVCRSGNDCKHLNIEAVRHDLRCTFINARAAARLSQTRGHVPEAYRIHAVDESENSLYECKIFASRFSSIPDFEKHHWRQSMISIYPSGQPRIAITQAARSVVLWRTLVSLSLARRSIETVPRVLLRCRSS